MKMSIFSVQDHYPSHSRTVSQLYQEILVQAELADALGYDTFWVAEHHFHEYGAVPNPAVMLASIAQRTKRLRLGTAISILTFHNPLTVAESYAMVDILSGGRLMYGVGSGYLSHEFAGYAGDHNSVGAALQRNVAETDGTGRETAEGALNLYVDSRLYAKKSNYEDAMKNGLHLFGSVENVAEKLVELKKMGVGHVMALQNFGLLSQKHVHSSMERLMKDVMPMFTTSPTNHPPLA